MTGRPAIGQYEGCAFVIIIDMDGLQVLLRSSWHDQRSLETTCREHEYNVLGMYVRTEYVTPT